MLTNEEALRLIKECEECFVVWATDKNAIVAVHPIPKEEAPLKAVATKVEAMAAMKTDYKGDRKKPGEIVERLSCQEDRNNFARCPSRSIP